MLKEVNSDYIDVILNIVYATPDNFVNKQIYKFPACFLHEEALEKLIIASNIARKIGYTLKIYDGFRPIEAQKILWSIFPDENYVSNPNDENSALTHCRGIALDVHLVGQGGNELDMGTEVDEMNEKSFSVNYQDISEEALLNRLMLRGIMTVAGFEPMTTEWWHFNLPGYKNYPIIKSSVVELIDTPG